MNQNQYSGSVAGTSLSELDEFVQNTLFSYDYVDILKNLERYPILTVTGEPFVPKRISEEAVVIQTQFVIPSLPTGNIGCNVFFSEGPPSGPKCVPNNRRFVNPSWDDSLLLFDEVRHFQKWMQSNADVLFAGLNSEELNEQAEQYCNKLRDCLVGVGKLHYNQKETGMLAKHKILIFIGFVMKVLHDNPTLFPSIRLFQIYNSGHQNL